ncbi:TIGR02588 family protein [Neorhizobium sp. NPDC001467]|uniref:TIGR02588 family protein n=1 Tax=Neorhizobium sp. NPDC001467 TaxID=3390595 RepID=UPI003D028E24
MSKAKGRQTETNDPHWIEWTTGTVSCILVGSMIGWIAWQAITATEEPPLLSATVTRIEKERDLFRVEFELGNASPTTAAAVTVMGEIGEAAQTVESAEVTFDYVPAQSKARGAMLFRTDPAGRDLRIKPAGYTEP